jgi:Rieske Fe-S protein
MRQESASGEDGTRGETEPLEGNTRRGLLTGIGLVGAAGLAAACGSNGGSASTSQASQPASGSPAAPGGGAALAKTSDIPVGGGKIFAAEKVVVTQPVAGEFKAFTAVCQHMGCTVGSVSGGTINCPCHGSKYKITDASVVAGPAPRPLPAKQITVKGGDITLG